MASSIRLLAQYNTLANQRIITSVNSLALLHNKHSNCLFFDTIHGTVNHIAGVTDLWLSRIFDNPEQAKKYHFLYQTTSAASSNNNKTDGEQWLALQPDWEKSCLWLLEISKEAERSVRVATLSDLFIGAPEGKMIKYNRTDGTVVQANSIHCLTHLFNHNTHHRGQIHAALCEFGVKDCTLDISAVVPGFAREM